MSTGHVLTLSLAILFTPHLTKLQAFSLGPILYAAALTESYFTGATP